MAPRPAILTTATVQEPPPSLPSGIAIPDSKLAREVTELIQIGVGLWV